MRPDEEQGPDPEPPITAGGDGQTGAEDDPLAEHYRAEAEQAAAQGERFADEARRPTLLWALLSGWLLAIEAWLQSHGGPRLRGGIRAFWALVAIGGIVLLVGPVINRPLTLDDITSSASNATETWIARDFSADYTLSRDPDGTLRAHVVEQIDAFFPADVDEDGIERVLATEYEGHALSPSGITATLDGEPLEPTRQQRADRLTLGLDTGQRLQGDHEFDLSYDLVDLAYSTTDEASGQPIDLLAWDVFGPSWPQAFAGLTMTITLTADLDAQLIRPPRGDLAWTLIGSGDWLDPDHVAADGSVTYSLRNDQNIPPHAQAWFTLSFADGTFAMPPRTPLFWLQTWGPLLPLLILAATLLFALAARAVAWADARGRAWYVAQDDPPTNVGAGLAAQILRRPGPLELAVALEGIPKAGRTKAARRAAELAAARAARRTGRLGNLGRVLARHLLGPDRRAALQAGLRRIPRGFVRDHFIAAPIALTLVQWGLVRQLSHQARLAVVWWPVAFVIGSSLVALIVLGIALAARPLTEQGALLRQHLLGIGVFAARTRLLDRADPRDPLLPYAVLTVRAREAGRRVLSLLTADLGPAASRGWRTRDFVTWPRLIVRIASVLAVAGAIALVATVTSPYSRGDDSSDFDDVPGTYQTTFDSFAASAELTEGPDGDATLRATETITAEFDDSGASVPQLARRWPDLVDGQRLGLVVDAVRVDGSPIAFTTREAQDAVELRTALTQVLSGKHEVAIDYRITRAAVAAISADGALVDRVPWTALLDGWRDDLQWHDTPVRIELRIPAALAAATTSAGWITLDTTADSARDWTESIVPFGTVEPEQDPDGTALAAETSGHDGTDETHSLVLLPDGYGTYSFPLTLDGVGTDLEFPAGTFPGADPAALRLTQILTSTPLVLDLTLAGLAILLAALAIVARVRRDERLRTPGLIRDLLLWAMPAMTLAELILFAWLTADMAEDDPLFPPLGIGTLLALIGCVVGLVATLRRPRPTGG